MDSKSVKYDTVNSPSGDGEEAGKKMYKILKRTTCKFL